MLLLCWCVALVVASCGATSLDGTSSIPDEARTTTTAAPGTTAPPPSDAVPSWFRIGDDGLWLVADGSESLLVPEPVSWAAADYLGGVVFRYGWQVDRPGVYRLLAGSSDPELVSSYAALPTRFDGRASLVTFVEVLDQLDAEGIVERVEVIDLLSGERVPVTGSFGYAGQDRGGVPSSAGGRLLAGIEWIASGSCGTDTAVVLWSIDEGGAIDSPYNPFPDMCNVENDILTCEPAGLGARLSPDGSLLAVLHAPVAKWPCPDLDDIGDEEWMATVAGTPVALSVIDLGTGADVWSGSTPFPATLADFDGRYLVLHGSNPISVIVDTVGDHEPIDVDGWIVLDRDAELPR
jgi:hypothetical protein